MLQVKIEDAEHSFSKLIQDVLQGEEIVITQNAKPVAKLISMVKSDTYPIKKIKPGSAKGLIKISDDFDDPLDDFKEYMGRINENT